MEVTGLKETVVRLESSLTEKQNEILFLEEEVRSLRMKLTKRDAELIKQERELNKLRVKKTNKLILSSFLRELSLAHYNDEILFPPYLLLQQAA